MNRTEQDAAFAENVGLVLEFERRLEGAGGAEPDRPGQGIVGRLPVGVLMDGEAAIDPGAVDVAALLVEPSDRWSHPLRANPDDVDVVAEGLAGALDESHQKTVGQPESGAGPERRHDPVEIIGLCSVRNQQQYEVRSGDHLVHLAARPVGLGKPGLLDIRDRTGVGTQPDLDADAAAGERFPEILRLGRPLRGPPDHADLADPGKGLGQQRKEMTAAAHDPLLGAAEDDLFFLEHRRVERHLVASLLASAGIPAVRDSSRVTHALTLYQPAFFGRCKPLDSMTVEKLGTALRLRTKRKAPPQGAAPPQLLGGFGIL